MPPDPPPASLVTIRQFRDVPIAEVARTALESAGIQAFLHDDNTIRMDWFLSNAIGGVKLLVRQEDVPAAEEILNLAPLDKFPTGDGHEFVQPKCPECGSLDISFAGLRKGPAYFSLFLGVPVPFVHEAWHCNSCGAQLEEVADPPAAGNPSKHPSPDS